MRTVLFICQDKELPSSRIRVRNLITEIKSYDIVSEVVEYPKTMSGKKMLMGRLKGFDIVYLQKKLLSLYEAYLFRRNSQKLVFDFDDAIYYRDDSHNSFFSISRHMKFRRIVTMANVVIAGNTVLADFASRFNINTVILPSAVETRGIPVKDYSCLSQETIIGWVGGKGNLHHLMMIAPVLRRLGQAYSIRLHVVSNSAVSIDGVRIKHIPWSLDSQETEIALFDIGVMPLPDNKWTEGKCGYKAIQYMAAGVTPVCSDVGGNRDIVENGKEGFVVPTMEAFYEALETLIKNSELRREMGRNARRKAEEHFSIPVVALKLASILNRP